MSQSLRITEQSATDRRISFTFDGGEYEAREGEPIAVALYAANVRTLGAHERNGEPRGLYCGLGHCYSCRVTVDGVRDVRACITPVQAGMHVLSQQQQGGSAQ